MVRYAQRQRDRQVLFVCSLSLSGFNRQVQDMSFKLSKNFL
jgi:hypothetical protein